MGRGGWGLATGLAVITAGACGGRLAPIGEREHDRDAGVVGVVILEGGVDAEDGAVLRDGPPNDERGPPPVPVCTAENSMCIPPEAGIVWTGAAIIQCQPEQYVGPWTVVLERLIGTTYQVLQKQVVQEPGFGFTFEDTTGPPSRLTYRVCVVEADMTLRCGNPVVTQGPASCACEPTTCALQTACNTTLDDECGGTLTCGACSNGMTCNPANHSCCPAGFMPDGWGGCACAPTGHCPIQDWDTTLCTCVYSAGWVGPT